VAAAAKKEGPTQVPAPVTADPGTAVVVSSSGSQLTVARPLALDERMIALACAITVDYDYFSQHSHGSGMGGMLMPVPFPMPGGGSAGVEPDDGAGMPPVDGGAAGAQQAADSDNTQGWMDDQEDTAGDLGGDGGDWDMWDMGRSAGQLFGVLPSDDE